MGLDVIFIRDVESYVLAGIVQIVQGAKAQGADPQYLAGALSGLQYICLATKGDWRKTLLEATALLGAGQKELLGMALQLETGRS